MKRKYIYRLFLPAIMLLAAGCSNELQEDFIPAGKAGEEIRVGIKMDVVPTTSGDALTRSITSADNVDEGFISVPKNVWVFQYDENGVQIGQPRYLDFEAGASTTQIPALHSGTAQHTLVFLANSHDANLAYNLGDIRTLDLLKSKTQQIEYEMDCYTKGYSGNDLLLNGYYTGVINGGAITVNLYRNIVKLSLKLQNDAASGLTIESVQVFNIPAGIYYADQLQTTVNGRFPATEMIDYMDYPAENLNMAAGDAAKTITWYMPRNELGTIVNTDSQKKNAYAPARATYIRIVSKNADNQSTIFTFYPGANLTNDFNLKGNYSYTVSIKINSKGNFTTDSRIQDFDRKDFISANSFILNPAPAGTKQRVFTLPIDRVNEFWSLADYGDPANVLDSETEWVATLIWQDVDDPDFIRFIDEDTGVELLRLNGKGPNQRIFVTTDGRNVGNALIGLRKADLNGDPIGEEFLWSWHLWITDYNPEILKNLSPLQDKYIYHVPGGAVHRYAGAIWETTEFQHKYIMDRNLGASDIGYNSGVLDYVFGRKDPFPCVPLYDISGVRIYFDTVGSSDPISKVRGPVSFAIAIKNPVVYYYVSQGNWNTPARSTPWNSLIAEESKSFFDPCPPGWKVPSRKIWDDFRYDSTDPQNSTAINIAREGIIISNTGGNYYPLGSADDLSSKMFYPFNAGRLSSNGTRGGGTSGNAYCWAEESIGTSGYCLKMNSTSVNVTSWARSYGNSVRCIQE